MSVSGLGFVGADIGGFFPNDDIYEIFSRKGYPYQVTNKLDGERFFLFFNNNQ